MREVGRPPIKGKRAIAGSLSQKGEGKGHRGQSFIRWKNETAQTNSLKLEEVGVRGRGFREKKKDARARERGKKPEKN